MTINRETSDQELTFLQDPNLGFYYPARISKSFDWPWECDKWLNFFHSKWTSNNKDNKSIWSGRRILGFKTLTVTWNCDPLEAYFIYKQGRERLYNYLEDLIEEDKEEKCCGGGCGCH